MYLLLFISVFLFIKKVLTNSILIMVHEICIAKLTGSVCMKHQEIDQKGSYKKDLKHHISDASCIVMISTVAVT